MTKRTNPDVIPRPLNCFLIYRLEKQQEIVAKCSGANHRDISKIIAKWWKEASEEEKRPFREKARLAKLEHSKLYPGYKYAPQKKSTPRRVYVRRNKKEKFTSRYQENNKLMEMIYEDSNALQLIDAIPSVPKKSSAQRPKTTNQTKNISSSISNEVSYGDLNQMDNYLGYQLQTNFQSMSYLSPFTETYSEYDAPSPFSGSVNSFDVTQSFILSPSPGIHLETPYVNNNHPIEQPHSFNNFSPMDINCSFDSNLTMTEFDMLFTPGYNMIDSQSNDYFMSQKPSEYIDPNLLHA